MLEQLTGRQKLSSRDLDNWHKELERRVKHSQDHGYDYRMILIPNKHCVFKEFLPPSLIISDDRPAVQLASRFPDVVHYPLELLRSIPYSYYKTDTHWTEVGIVNWLNSMASEIGAPQLAYDLEYKTYCGDLGEKVSLPVSETAPFLSFTSSSTLKYDNGIKNIGTIKYYENTNPSLPVACIFGDSFLNSYCHILSQFFSKLYFFHYWGFDETLIEQIKPDIVWNENIERFISFSRNASFKDIFYNKFFKGNFDLHYHLRNFTGVSDGITSVDYALATKYLASVNQAATREDFYKKQYDFAKHHGISMDMADDYWKPDARNRFTAWAIGLTSEELVQGNGIQVYLANLFFNTYLSLEIFPFPKNEAFFNLSRATPLFAHKFFDSSLEIHNDNQKIVFPFIPALKKKIARITSLLLLVLHGDNYLGIGKRINMAANPWQNGYFAMNFSSHFHSVRSGSIDWRLVQNRAHN